MPDLKVLVVLGIDPVKNLDISSECAMECNILGNSGLLLI
jgi:hypothetical protein